MANWINRFRRGRAPFTGWRDAPAIADSDWERIARLAVAGGRGVHQVTIRADRCLHGIKLRSINADIDVYRWVLEFQDGTILDLSVNCLLEGSESRPMPISGRQLKRIVVRFDARRFTRRARLEIWAQP